MTDWILTINRTSKDEITKIFEGDLHRIWAELPQGIRPQRPVSARALVDHLRTVLNTEDVHITGDRVGNRIKTGLEKIIKTYDAQQVASEPHFMKNHQLILTQDHRGIYHGWEVMEFDDGASPIYLSRQAIGHERDQQVAETLFEADILAFKASWSQDADTLYERVSALVKFLADHLDEYSSRLRDQEFHIKFEDSEHHYFLPRSLTDMDTISIIVTPEDKDTPLKVDFDDLALSVDPSSTESLDELHRMIHTLY